MCSYTKDTFREETKTTIGVEFGHKTLRIEDKVIKAQIWDTAGQERFKAPLLCPSSRVFSLLYRAAIDPRLLQALTRGYYRGALGALLTYSITSRQSFENCETWLEELVQHADPGILVMLVGNKTDLANQRDVSTEEGREFAAKNKLSFIETSAKDKTNVNEAFERLVHEIFKQVNGPHPDGDAHDVDGNEPARPAKGMVLTPPDDDKSKADGKKEDDCKC